MQLNNIRSKTALAAAAAAAALSLIGTITPAHAASSTYTVTIDTTEYLRATPSRPADITFILARDIEDKTGFDNSYWMSPVQRDVLRVNVNRGQRPFLFAMDRRSDFVAIVDLQGKRYLRIGGPVNDPDICGWMSFASRNSGNTGSKLHGNSMGECHW